MNALLPHLVHWQQRTHLQRNDVLLRHISSTNTAHKHETGRFEELSLLCSFLCMQCMSRGLASAQIKRSSYSRVRGGHSHHPTTQALNATIEGGECVIRIAKEDASFADFLTILKAFTHCILVVVVWLVHSLDANSHLCQNIQQSQHWFDRRAAVS